MQSGQKGWLNACFAKLLKTAPGMERLVIKMSFSSVKGWLEACSTQQLSLWELILLDDMRERGIGRDDSLREMKQLWAAMRSAGADYDGSLRSASGLTGGDGAKLAAYFQQGGLADGYIGQVMIHAVCMAESNACMKRIVASPTAGACGVLPAVLLPLQEAGATSEDQILRALYVAGGFGQIIAQRATISGAQGGCQAEIGSASAMAAAALVFLRGGDGEACAHACAMALSNLLGLVCDPVAGLVEAPCVKRNVIGAMNAVSCADMALAGLQSVIPADEVIDAMGDVGRAMPEALRETSLGGLAATPTGQTITNRLRNVDQ